MRAAASRDRNIRCSGYRASPGHLSSVRPERPPLRTDGLSSIDPGLGQKRGQFTARSNRRIFDLENDDESYHPPPNLDLHIGHLRSVSGGRMTHAPLLVLGRSSRGSRDSRSPTGEGLTVLHPDPCAIAFEYHCPAEVERHRQAAACNGIARILSRGVRPARPLASQSRSSISIAFLAAR